MENEPIKISKRLISYIIGKSTSEENSVVEEWLSNRENKAYFDDIKKELLYDIKKEYDIEYSKEKKDFFNMVDGRSIRNNHKSKRINIYNILTYVGVISIIMLIPLIFYMLNDKSSKQISGNEQLKIKIENPVLITSSGDKVALLPNEIQKVLKENNGVNVSIKGKLLSYHIDNSIIDDIEYHTIKVPKCGNYQFTMLDGSKVWLNSKTTLKYPIPFHKNRREVILDGEAYFEVTKDYKKPFIVKMANGKVKVLGTKFNINNYNGKRVTTTLVSGKVQVNDNNDNIVILMPEQQSIFKDKKIIVNDVDPFNYTCWKDGYFLFNKVTVDEILKELSEWYDFEYFYQNKVDNKSLLRIKVRKFDNLKDVLSLIEKTTDIKFRIKGKTIIVFN